MTFFEIVLVAISLAMDAFAVSISVGMTGFLCCKRAKFRISFHFGLFQALMPIFGWYAGIYIEAFIRNFSHWIAFVLLLIIGFKMIHESLDPEQHHYKLDPSKGLQLIFLSVATSIDALAIGLSFGLIGIRIWYPAVMIGIITGIISLFGIFLGDLLKEKTGKKFEMVGGIVLIIIGMKILLENFL